MTQTTSSVPLRPPAITVVFVLLLHQHPDQQYVSRLDARVLHVDFSHSNNIFISYRRIFFGFLAVLKRFFRFCHRTFSYFPQALPTKYLFSLRFKLFQIEFFIHFFISSASHYNFNCLDGMNVLSFKIQTTSVFILNGNALYAILNTGSKH